MLSVHRASGGSVVIAIAVSLAVMVMMLRRCKNCLSLTGNGLTLYVVLLSVKCGMLSSAVQVLIVRLLCMSLRCSRPCSILLLSLSLVRYSPCV